MLTVPPAYSLGYALLLATPSGSALIASASLANAVGTINPGGLGGAYGRAMDGSRLELTNTVLPAPNQACLLAHELTHCLDLAFWNAIAGGTTEAQLGATEINAHYNQGLIAKELVASGQLSPTLVGEVQTLMGGFTTWGRMGNAWERDQVFTYLDSTAQYGAAVRTLLATKPLYVWTKDSEWERGRNLFHCERHLDDNTRERLAKLNMAHDPVW